MGVDAGRDLYDGVVGQDQAVAALRAAASRPVHAYLLLGPPGTGKRQAATGFAASLLCPTGGVHISEGHVSEGHVSEGHVGEGQVSEGQVGEGQVGEDHVGSGPAVSPHLDDVCRRVLAGVHPDVIAVEREGAFIGMAAAREVTRTAYMSPVEGGRKVVILHDFHLVRDSGPALLKTIEEPPPSTVFIVLAEYLPPELVTIASRCVTVEFRPLAISDVVAALVNDGVEAERANQLAAAAGGRLDRARLLASDPEFETRRHAWHSVPSRLDGHGSTAASVADELIGYLESSVAPLRDRQEREAEELAQRNARAAEVTRGGAGSKGRASKAAIKAGMTDLEERHRRELRRQRTDELRAGLATMAAAYRERIAAGSDGRRRLDAIESIAQIDRTVRSLAFNPGELLALQALLARLGRIQASG